MALEIYEQMGWTFAFIVLGCAAGLLLFTLSLKVIKQTMDRLTPLIDEDKEMLRGNLAVAEYFGRVLSAAIIGFSMILSASILGGFFSAFSIFR